ncbi:hypothetical protein [Alkalihalophilus marmarensis]|uniref:hypothetical protein n=1 Tax=Alkalihalophilus marmarensis TaxID=521377 RepID=UPI002DBB57BA|nr:hypothetical protein [Alkalihalophilus marmarensis]MEC2071383.1 hypothetical protein [Alkalihalophilus marmarensis]
MFNNREHNGSKRRYISRFVYSASILVILLVTVLILSVINTNDSQVEMVNGERAQMSPNDVASKSPLEKVMDDRDSPLIKAEPSEKTFQIEPNYADFKGFEELYSKSEFVVKGKPLEKEEFYYVGIEDFKMPLTGYVFEVAEVFKGKNKSSKGETFVVFQDGNEIEQASNVTLMEVGGDYLLFLVNTNMQAGGEQTYMVEGGPIGMFINNKSLRQYESARFKVTEQELVELRDDSY